jgi:hypothetical protein
LRVVTQRRPFDLLAPGLRAACRAASAHPAGPRAPTCCLRVPEHNAGRVTLGDGSPQLDGEDSYPLLRWRIRQRAPYATVTIGVESFTESNGRYRSRRTGEGVAQLPCRLVQPSDGGVLPHRPTPRHQRAPSPRATRARQRSRQRASQHDASLTAVGSTLSGHLAAPRAGGPAALLDQPLKVLKVLGDLPLHESELVADLLHDPLRLHV